METMALNGEVMDENNNNLKEMLKTFDSEPGYYCQVIRTMLTPGHETELIYWLKSFGLIPNIQICKNADVEEECNKLMEWTPVKTVDFYQWKCRSCFRKTSIRENSVFQDIKCNFNNAIRILLGWCKGYDVETMANVIGAKNHVVRALYNVVSNTAKKHLKYTYPDKQIGGEGVVVLVDIYPDGCTNTSRPVRGNRAILCLAEVKDIPPNYWFEALDRFHRNNPEQVTATKEHILRVIQETVLPGSVLVAPISSPILSHSDLKSLQDLYPTIVSVEGLSRHNTMHEVILNNLETIWRLALTVCEEAQLFNYEEIPIFLISYMWHTRFGNEGFEVLLNRLADLQ